MFQSIVVLECIKQEIANAYRKVPGKSAWNNDKLPLSVTLQARLIA